MPIFLMQCSSKKEDITAETSDIDFLQEQLDDLEYIVKNNTGNIDSENINSFNEPNQDQDNHAETIQILNSLQLLLSPSIRGLMTFSSKSSIALIFFLTSPSCPVSSGASI